MFSLVTLDGYTPAVGSESYDLVANGNLYTDFEIPVWIAFSFWVTTADVLAAADGFQLDLNYVDPTGQTITVNGTPFSLGNAAGFSTIPVTQIQRQSGSSLVEIVATRGGGGLGSPVVAGRIMMSRFCFDNLAVNNIWTP